MFGRPIPSKETDHLVDKPILAFSCLTERKSCRTTLEIVDVRRLTKLDTEFLQRVSKLIIIRPGALIAKAIAFDALHLGRSDKESPTDTSRLHFTTPYLAANGFRVRVPPDGDLENIQKAISSNFFMPFHKTELNPKPDSARDEYSQRTATFNNSGCNCNSDLLVSEILDEEMAFVN